MAMRVPINPQTRVPQGQLGYAKPVDVSSGIRALGNIVREYGEDWQQEQKKKELFDIQRMLVDETNEIQTEFEKRTAAQPLGAPQFTEQVNRDYTARHRDLAQRVREQGYSADAVNEFETRLGTIRAQYVAKAIDFQDKSGFAKVATDSDNLAISLSQYTNKNPNAIGSALDEFRVGLSNTGLDATEQATLYERGKGVIIRGAQEGFAMQNPEVILELYGVPNETTIVENKATGELVNLSEAQKVVGAELTNAGFNPNVIAGFLGNFHVEGGYTGKAGDNGTAGGIAQWRKERRANFVKMFGKDPTKATMQENAQFVIWEMKNPKEAGMTVAQRDAILAAKTPEQAAELVDKYYERSNGKARSKRVEAAKLFVRTMAHADTTTAALTQPPSTIDATGKTGIPVLDLSTGPERMQMLTLARTIMNGRKADAEAAQRAAHEEWYNGFLNGLQDGKLGQADLNQAYAEGRITDFDERKKAQGILDDKNKKDNDLVMFSAMLQSGGKFNPYDPKAQAAVDAGFAKAVELEVKSGNQPNPYVIALRTWQRTGVLPKQGGVMIRGGLIGTDPKNVAASASVASNMLAQNPNAFAGVEGGEDIGKAAATYAHYVDDLGMTAEEAAQKIATMNSPEAQIKLKADEPSRTKFIKAVNENNIERTLNNAIVGEVGGLAKLGNVLTLGTLNSVLIGDRGRMNTPQKAEAKQTFTELALDHYDRYFDPDAATAYASRQMARFYGVENGRLLKYPATKAYPEIMGTREYVFDQAKAEVDKFAGFSIPKEDIWLQPTANGSTAAAFRAGKLPPYEVHFISRKNGQAVYHYIPGKAFVADIDTAKRDAAAKAREVERKARNRSILLDVSSGIGLTK